jgi:hypothetical protein
MVSLLLLRSVRTHSQMHHLAGVGHLLGSVIQSPLSQWTYLQVRNVLLAMVDLLASLEANTSTEGGSTRLKAHIQRIDAYMTNAARDRQGKEVYHSALPKEAWTNEHEEQSLRTTVSSQPGENFDRVVQALIIQYDIYTAGTMSSRPSVEGSGTNNPTGAPPEPVNLNSLNQVAEYTSSSIDDAFGQPQPEQVDSQQWFSQQNISPNQQVQLPESFFADWPFDMGQGEAFNFLGDFQTQPQVGGNGAANGSGSHVGVEGGGGIGDILGVGMPEGFVGAGQIGGVLGSMGFSGGQ